MLAYVLSAVAWCFARLPAGLLAGLASCVAFLQFDVLRIRRRVILENLQTAFPDWSDARRIQAGRGGCRSFFQTVLEFVASERYFDRAEMEVVNKGIMDEALARGGGVYIVCIHMGNWEFLCSRGSRYFNPVSILAKDIGTGEGAKWVTQTRARNGCYVIPRNGEVPAALQIPKLLKAGNIIGFIVDQHKPGGVRVPLFGKPAFTNSGLLQLWMRHPAPILPAIARRVSATKHQMIFLPEFQVEKPEGAKFKETVVQNTARLNLVVEEMIRMNPDQYFWMHRRWKG